MIFTRKKNINIDINFSNQPIEIVNQFKYLGLIIDEKLTFKPHIEYIKNKINQGNGKIYYLSKFLSIDILKKVFYSIIYSHLNLHILIWGGSTDSALNPLITSVNKTIRNIYHSKDNTAAKYKKLKILTVPQLYDLKLGEFMFKIIQLNDHQLLQNIIPEISFHHPYRTRNFNSFRNPPSQIEPNKRFFVTNAIKFWRTIPNDTKNSSSLNIFRKKIKDMFLNTR